MERSTKRGIRISSLSSGRGRWGHADYALVDGAKDGAVLPARFHANAVAELHERRLGLAARNGFDRAAFRDAGGPLLAACVRHGARADDRAGAQATRRGCMRNELVETEIHLAAVRVAEPL